MKTNELRIGNRLIYDKDDLVTVTAIYQGSIITTDGVRNHNGFSMNMYMGVPITEEWLLKAGFDKKFDEIESCIAFVKDDLFLKYDLKNELYCVFSGYLNDEDHQYYLRQYKYIHQLQNLYFALTGEELIPKES